MYVDCRDGERLAQPVIVSNWYYWTNWTDLSCFESDELVRYHNSIIISWSIQSRTKSVHIKNLSESIQNKSTEPKETNRLKQLNREPILCWPNYAANSKYARFCYRALFRIMISTFQNGVNYILTKLSWNKIFFLRISIAFLY